MTLNKIVLSILLITIVGCNQSTNKNSLPSATTTPETIKNDNIKTIKTDNIIKGNKVSISLPESYKGGNPKTESEKIINQIKEIKPEYAETFRENLQQNPNTILLVAFDDQAKKDGFPTNVNILNIQLPVDTTLQKYLETAKKQSNPDYQILQTEIVKINNLDTGRIVAETPFEKGKIKHLSYIIAKGQLFWLITYATNKEEFEQRLPTFEQSISSLVIE
jgi:hypothetical protein